NADSDIFNRRDDKDATQMDANVDNGAETGVGVGGQCTEGDTAAETGGDQQLQLQLHRNWAKGRAKYIKFPAHGNHVVTCL
ncbi:hypothetical protein DFQ27_002484, partial [Actinomortierella ambigua]